MLTLALAVCTLHPSLVQSADAPQDSLTIAQCVSLARAHAPEVLARAADLTGARFDSSAAARNRRPALALNSEALVAPEGFYDPAATNLGEYSGKLTAQLPLVDGGARRRERLQAALGVTAAGADRDQAEREAATQAATAAVGVLRRQEIEAADRDALEWLDRLGSLIESGVRAGAHTPSDVVRVQLERDAVESDLLTVSSEREALGRELAQLVGRDPAVPVAVVEPDSAAELSPTDADSAALVAADVLAPEVRAARAAAARQRLTLEQARRHNALAIDLSADAGIWGTNLTQAVPDDFRAERPGATFGDRLRRDLGASVSLQIHRPLLDPTARLLGSAEEARSQGSEARARAAELERRRATLDLLGRWRASVAKSTLARQSLARARDHLLRLRSLYAGGATTLLELLDARRQLDEARTRLFEARSEARQAQWEGEIRR